MLTKEYMDKNFITAHFCDNERTQIEIITKTNMFQIKLKLKI